MTKQHHFDHILGEQNAKTDTKDVEILKRIIKAHSEEYFDEEKMDFKRIGLHLRMKRYLAEPIKEIIPVGHFLKELLEIYGVKKIKFAEFIEYENSNLHAVLQGRRRLSNKIALKIGAIFLIDPQIWMFVDAKNELLKFQKEKKFMKSKYTIDRLKGVV